MSEQPQRSPGEVADELQGDDPAVRAAQTLSREAEAGQGLPNLDDVACEPGKTVTADLPRPVRVLAGPRRTLMVASSMEKSELARGQRDGVKCPGETLYMCRPADHPEANAGGYVAADLYVLDEPDAVPAAPARAVVVSQKAAELAEAGGVDLATVTGTGKNGNVTIADVRSAMPTAE